MMSLIEALARELDIYEALQQRTKDARRAEFEYNSIMTDDEIDNVLDGNPPVEFTERFQQRALKAMREAGKRRAVKFN